ncbi:endonuclease/exonuclease/phosphatase family protein [Kitasatospora sp. NPDC059811]|uniref:endonuclease/exonuclease/phosphatase family protein n=1 Tax=unclassified Kitasatospora TaxID=2633591 RepID=UPI0007AFD6B0
MAKAEAGPEAGGASAGVARPAGRRRRRQRRPQVGRWRRGRVAAAVALLTALALAGHRRVPSLGVHLGSLWESALPWAGVVVPAVLLVAALRRAPVPACAAVMLAAVWAVVLGPVLAGGGPPPGGGAGPAGGAGLTAVTHNVSAQNPDPAGTARALLAARPDLVALEEVTDAALPVYQHVLDAELPHRTRIGTVALWSRYPLTDARRLTIDPGWSRSLRAEVQAPGGPLAVYVVHLASVRLNVTGFATTHRDRNLAALGAALDEEPLRRVLLLGDLNTAAGDHALAPVTSRLSSAQDSAGGGFGFTWPAVFPLARIDHVMTRGLSATAAWTLPATSSDHLPAAARLTP